MKKFLSALIAATFAAALSFSVVAAKHEKDEHKAKSSETAKHEKGEHKAKPSETAKPAEAAKPAGAYMPTTPAKK